MQCALIVEASEAARRRVFTRLSHVLGLSGRVEQRLRLGPGVFVATEKHADVRPELVGKGAVRFAALEGEQGEVHPQVIAARVRRRPEGGIAMEPAQEPERLGHTAEPFQDGRGVSNLLPVGFAAQGEPRIGQVVKNRTVCFVEGLLALAAGGLRDAAYQALEPPAVALALFEKMLLLELVLEDEEHAGARRDRKFAEHLRDIVPELVLGEVLLEGVPGAQHAVLEPRPRVLSSAAQHRGHTEHAVAERERVRQGELPLGAVLDDVDDETDVDDVRFTQRRIRAVVGVPAVRVETVLREDVEVAAAPAPVVEDAPAAVQIAVPAERLKRRREGVARHRGPVALDAGRAVLAPPALRSPRR